MMNEQDFKPEIWAIQRFRKVGVRHSEPKVARGAREIVFSALEKKLVLEDTVETGSAGWEKCSDSPNHT